MSNRTSIAFNEDIMVDRHGNGSIAEGWDTPRGPLGGYVMAIVLEGMRHAVADDARQPRSLTVHFLRPPTAGPVVVRPTVERTGRSLTTVTARLEQDGRLIALGLAAFSTAWPGPEFDDAPPPQDVEPPDEQRPPARASFTDQGPPFTERITMQWRFGDPPFTSSDRGETGGWLALRENRPIDAAALCVFADAWFPSPWPRLDRLTPAPTVDLTVHFRAPLPLEDQLLLGHFQTTLVRDGFFEEDGRLWAQDGRLVAHSRQLGLLIATGA